MDTKVSIELEINKLDAKLQKIQSTKLHYIKLREECNTELYKCYGELGKLVPLKKKLLKLREHGVEYVEQDTSTLS